MNWDKLKSDKQFWITLGIVIVLGVLFILAGCLQPNISPIPSLGPATAQGALLKMVNQNWLVTLGILLCAVGVMTFINGSTKGMAWIGGGLTVIALAALTAAFFAILADYSGWIFLGLGVLTLIGFIAFIHTAADINQDGHIDWKDIKALFKWK